MTHKKTPWYTVYCAGTDELGALGKRWVLAEILHSHHTNMCTKIHKSTVIIMFNKTIKINHKTCLENTCTFYTCDEERWHNIECSTKIQRTELVASVLSYLK